MKISEALKSPTGEPSLEDRVKALESTLAASRAATLSSIGTLAYNDPEFGGLIVTHIERAVEARYQDDAADIGG